MKFEIEGTDRIREAASNIARLFSPAALTEQAIILAAEAGVKLKEAIVRKCVDEIYELSGVSAGFTPLALPGLASALGGEYGGLPSDRTEALMRAHEVLDEGLTQTVRVDPNAEAEPTPHSGRERVIDYAIPVHEGYTQWVMGKDTGVHHLGRPWFYDAVVEHGEEVCMYVVRAFEVAAERAFGLI
jgi:hypothetical protein